MIYGIPLFFENFILTNLNIAFLSNFLILLLKNLVNRYYFGSLQLKGRLVPHLIY